MRERPSRERLEEIRAEILRLSGPANSPSIAIEAELFAEIRARGAEIDALRAERDRLVAVLRSLVTKIRECEPALNNAFLIAQVHGMQYTGPNWATEFAEAEAVLKEPA